MSKPGVLATGWGQHIVVACPKLKAAPMPKTLDQTTKPYSPIADGLPTWSREEDGAF